MEPLSNVYKNASSYFESMHNRYPQSKGEIKQSELEYCQAMKELFLTKWVTHFDIPESIVGRLRDPKLESKWMKNRLISSIFDFWSDKVAMYKFIQLELDVALSAVTPAPPIVPEELKAAFKVNIVGESVDYVYDRLNHIAKEWKTKSADHYYPGTTITQTSGAGKSRSVVEIARSGKTYVVYYTFMKGQGFPKKSLTAPQFPLKCDRNIFLLFYCACLEYICTTDGSPFDMVEECMKEKSLFWEGVQKLTAPIQSKM